MSKYNRKKDDNHNEIKQFVESCGISWMDTHELGNDRPDAVVGKGPWNILVEIKSSKGKQTEGQSKFFKLWRGPKMVVKSCLDFIHGWYNITKEWLYSGYNR